MFFARKARDLLGFLYLFEGPHLRQVEEEYLLGYVNKGGLTMDWYCLERRMAGVFGVLSDLDVEYKGVV